MTPRSLRHDRSHAVAVSRTRNQVTDSATLADTVHKMLTGDVEDTAASTANIASALQRVIGAAAACEPVVEDCAARDEPETARDETRDSAQTSLAVDRTRILARGPMLLLAYRYLADQLSAIRESAPAALAGQSPEGVHQMRVAIRRTRAALKAYGPMLPRAQWREFGTGFRWLASTLGRVRDLDVYEARLARQFAMLAPEQAAALAPYRAHLHREYAEARARMVAAIEGPRYVKLLAAVAESTQKGPSAAALRRWGSFRVCDGAPEYLDAALRRVRKRGRRIDADSPPQALHELRIRAKRLRYLMEIFVPVYGKRLERLIKPVRRLQDALGEYQDACVAMSQLQSYGEGVGRSRNRHRELMALGCLMQLESEAAAAARSRFDAEWQRFDRKLERSRLLAAVGKSRD